MTTTRTNDPGAARARIDGSWSVNDVLARFPQAATVFNAFGVDTCCGGGVPLAEAAEAEGVPLDALLAALEAAIAPAR